VATCHPDLYPDPPRGGRELFGGVSEALLPFTQKRFLVSELIRAPPLPLSGWWAVEGAAGGERFMWGTAGARLWLPAVPATESVSLELRPAPGPTPLTVVVDDTELVELDGSSSRTLVWIGAEVAGARTGRLVEFRRSRSYPPGGGDHRPLAVQLFAVRAVGRLTRWQGSVTTAEERAEIGLRVDGFHAAEEFGDSGRGCWVQPLAWLEADAGEGTLVLWMWAPRPTPPRTRILMGGRVVAGPLEIGAHPVEVRISVAAGDVHGGRVRLELDSVPFNPAAAGAGADERDLGVVLGRVAFEPALPVE
jgi:hypothetical protein